MQNNHEIIEKYVQLCNRNVKENNHVLSLLKKYGIYENYIFENFCIGYSNGMLIDLIGGNEELKGTLVEVGLLKNGRELFKNYLTFPIYD